MKEIKVVELFAGVGGFRIGLEKSNSKSFKFNTVFASQFEPSKKNQFAYNCYKKNFGQTDTIISNEDIAQVEERNIPKHDLLVGGFPCQDYSVATTKAKGLQGKKEFLWWEIYRIIKYHNTNFLLLENVDRLLKSPTSQRGRDFAIMLKTLDELNYDVEWRVINAAEYGYPQKRRRVFIFAKKRNNIKDLNKDMEFLNNIFPAEINEKKVKHLFSFNFKEENSEWYTANFEKDLQTISSKYNLEKHTFGEMFRNSGKMINGKITSIDLVPKCQKNVITLGSLLEKNTVDESFFLSEEQNKKMKINKAGKRIPRKSKDGHEYMYSEGSMKYPDILSAPGRTMLTSEGTVNRSSHVVEDVKTGKLRFITPIEAERLNQFPDDWTKGMSIKERYFCMGNALVTGIVEKIGKEIINSFYE